MTLLVDRSTMPWAMIEGPSRVWAQGAVGGSGGSAERAPGAGVTTYALRPILRKGRVPSVPPLGEGAGMAASGLLRERDLRALTAVVADGLRDDPGPAMPWVVLHRLHELIPADTVLFAELDVKQGKPIADQFLNEGVHHAFFGVEPDVVPEREWALRQAFLPYSYSERTGDVAAVLRWSDFYTQAELKNQPFYNLVRQDSPVRYSIFVPLPTPAGQNRRIAFFRFNRDFSEQDRLALQLLRPHLHEVYRDAERRRHGIPHLSRRERDVLQLVSQGYSNADIARTLFISVATVRKHMENVFNRSGVRTRSAAAALALPYGGPLGPRPVSSRSGR
jgi:DNA-binding CsgD family transcriptional regulator